MIEPVYIALLLLPAFTIIGLFLKARGSYLKGAAGGFAIGVSVIFVVVAFPIEREIPSDILPEICIAECSDDCGEASENSPWYPVYANCFENCRKSECVYPLTADVYS